MSDHDQPMCSGCMRLITDKTDEIERLRADLDAATRLLGKLGYSPSEYLPSLLSEADDE